MLVTALLAWLHIISAISWLGGGIMFGFIVAPGVAKLSPPSSGEFFVRVAPRVARFFQIAAGSTVLFGVLLLYNMGGASLLSMSTSYGVDLSLGMLFALLAFIMSEFVAGPLLLKAVRLISEMRAAGAHEPPAELPRTLQLVGQTSLVMLVLLLLTSVFMVSAGFY